MSAAWPRPRVHPAGAHPAGCPRDRLWLQSHAGFESEELERHHFIFSHSPYFWLQILGCLLPTPKICDKE